MIRRNDVRLTTITTITTITKTNTVVSFVNVVIVVNRRCRGYAGTGAGGGVTARRGRPAAA